MWVCVGISPKTISILDTSWACNLVNISNSSPFIVVYPIIETKRHTLVLEEALCTVQQGLLHLLCCKKWSCCDPFQVTLPDGILPRQWHSATAIILYPGLVEVVMFGGSSDDYVDDKPDQSYSRLAETTIFSFGELVFCCCCVPVTLVCLHSTCTCVPVNRSTFLIVPISVDNSC